MQTLHCWWGRRALSFTLLLLLVGGCAAPKINWSERVGTFSYDQAVLDFGPPDKQATLTDGSIVAEWLTRRGRNHLYASPGFYPYWSASPFPTYLDTYTPDSFLRLTFDAGGKLKAWKQYNR